MARRSKMSQQKRQRELQKKDKAARKRAKRHGVSDEVFERPSTALRLSDFTADGPVRSRVVGTGKTAKGGD